MILHRYFSSHAFETLRDGELKASRISSFNDPFEFLYVSVGKVTPEDVRRFVRSRHSSPLFAICKSMLEQKMPGLQLTDQDFETFLNRHEAIAGIVQQWPSIVKKEDLSFERRRNLIDRDLRAICFCEPSRVSLLDEILLWSHYAKMHKGFRIEFDFPDGIKDSFEIIKIKYQEKRVEVVFSLGSDVANEQAHEALVESAKVKSKAWEYEHEFRLFTSTGACERKEISNHNGTSSGEYFLKFKREWVKSIDFGVLCPDGEIERAVHLVKTAYPKGTICKKARFHDTEYALEYAQIE